MSGAGVEHQQHLVGRLGIEFRDYPADLLQLFHQVRLGVEAPGRIRNQHVGSAGGGGVQGVVNHGSGIGAGVLCHYRDLITLTPGLELLDGGGAKGITGGKHHRTAVGLEAVGQLADGGGLAAAVDADHQHHEGSGERLRNLKRCRHRRQHREHLRLHRAQNGLRRSPSASFTPLRMPSTMRPVTATPTSAESRRSSISSSSASSTLAPPASSRERPSAIRPRVRPSAALSREMRPGAGGFEASSPASEVFCLPNM